MLRIGTTLAIALLLTGPAWAQYGHGCGAYIDPGALGQQTQATIDDNGIVTLRRTDVFRVYDEVQYREEARIRTVKTDGVERTVEYTVQVPIRSSKNVANNFQSRVPVNEIEAFDMSGKPVVADQLKQALKEEATVLLATRKVPSYYLSVYKPDTLLLVIESSNLFGAHVGGGAYAPNEGGEIAPPAPGGAPVPQVAGGPVRDPVSAPAPAPVANPLPAASAKPMPGMPPRVSMAKSVNDMLVLRTFLKDIATQTAYREVRQNGVTKIAPFSVETISITNVETMYPQYAVRVHRADGKPVTAEEIAELLTSEQGVILSADGKNIDPNYLKIVHPGTLIIVVPIPEPPLPPVRPAGAAPASALAPVPAGSPA